MITPYLSDIKEFVSVMLNAKNSRNKKRDFSLYYTNKNELSFNDLISKKHPFLPHLKLVFCFLISLNIYIYIFSILYMT